MPALVAACGLLKETSSPRHTIEPASALCTPASTLISVDLPAPFWPSRQWTSPGRTSSSTPSSARTPGKVLTMPVSVSSGWSGAVICGHLHPALRSGRVDDRLRQHGGAQPIGEHRQPVRAFAADPVVHVGDVGVESVLVALRVAGREAGV